MVDTTHKKRGEGGVDFINHIQGILVEVKMRHNTMNSGSRATVIRNLWNLSKEFPYLELAIFIAIGINGTSKKSIQTIKLKDISLVDVEQILKRKNGETISSELILETLKELKTPSIKISTYSGQEAIDRVFGQSTFFIEDILLLIANVMNERISTLLVINKSTI